LKGHTWGTRKRKKFFRKPPWTFGRGQIIKHNWGTSWIRTKTAGGTGEEVRGVARTSSAISLLKLGEEAGDREGGYYCENKLNGGGNRCDKKRGGVMGGKSLKKALSEQHPTPKKKNQKHKTQNHKPPNPKQKKPKKTHQNII